MKKLFFFSSYIAYQRFSWLVLARLFVKLPQPRRTFSVFESSCHLRLRSV